MTEEKIRSNIEKLSELRSKYSCFDEKEEPFYHALSLGIKALEQEPCDDCISRQAVLEYIEGSEAELGHSSENELVCQDIKALPPVTPQPKTGYWIKMPIGFKCSNCNELEDRTTKYCPNCGFIMVEPQESEAD